MQKVFEAKITEDGFGIRVVAKGDTSVTDWVGTLNSSIDLTVDAKVPGDDWREVMSKGVGLAYEDFWQIAGTGVGFKVGEIEMTGERSGRCKLKLKIKAAGSKKTLDETWVRFSL